MTGENLFLLFTLAMVSAWTPGPNNALVASSGANFGLRRSLPHILGIGIGFPFMIFIVGFFLGELFQSSSVLRQGLRWLGALILLWIAYKIATSGGISAAKGNPRPFRFLEAAAFQWVNPKAWSMAIAITSQFITGEAPFQSATIVAGMFVLAGLSSASGWAIAGQWITRWVNTPSRLQRFNLIMALLIVACVVLLFIT